ncbi:protein translocase subunit SecF [endosymbiont of unidentified scaly snail isolate Monju]|uniref:protein translocase subunit SecF n=1 Tax=endosymbiont of unidentified scaly snail isolate Monju TaxID=1248727 RepID=UPI0003892ADF|nr:protein translocase subunit SecF [endosymbiont of unidentified scaly snail isolate Monju]BAN69682.1 preprotein translocase subunit SecF [endosymbiont of unidentified scaly snail isolate Monju]
MRFIKSGSTIDFMGKRRLALVFSGAAMVVAVIAIVLRGLNLGIDFTGGTLIEVSYRQDVDIAQVRKVLAEAGFENASVQRFGTPRDILIRLQQQDSGQNKVSDQVFASLSKAAGGQVELRRVEFVGPQVGDELTEDGALAVLVALMAILIYVALRFEWRFALGSVIALVHDVLFTLGLFALLQIEFDLTVLAAVLAVIGYSLNDTIVVFDRVRENFRKLRKGTPEEVINISLNQTLSRTLMTSFTTILVLLALFFLGGEIIHAFAFALLVGIFIGTYSSIYVASTAALMLGVSKADLMPVKKEGVVDDMP